MDQHTPGNTGKLLLRLTCGCLLFLHGSFKVFGGIDSVKTMVAEAGLPSFLAYGTIIGEFVAPVFLVIGWKTRIAALIIAFNMLMSILVAHRDIMFRVNEYWGWMIELNVFYMMTALVIFFIGAGRYSLSKGVGRWD
jgi:putative oxidoreductase